MNCRQILRESRKKLGNAKKIEMCPRHTVIN